MASKRIKDVDFAVDGFDGSQRVYATLGEALTVATVQSLSNGKPAYVDVLVWSASGARAWGGDDGLDRYSEDPDASVFQRIEIRATDLGRVA